MIMLSRNAHDILLYEYFILLYPRKHCLNLIKVHRATHGMLRFLCHSQEEIILMKDAATSLTMQRIRYKMCHKLQNYLVSWQSRLNNEKVVTPG